MELQSLQNIQNDEEVRKRLAKKIVRDCFRNSVFENFHAQGTTLTNAEVKEIMIDSVNLTYKFLSQLSTAMGDQIIDNLKERDEIPEWQDPVEPKLF